MFIIKANEPLFNGFTRLSERVKNLRQIVQNDMELSESDIEKFKTEVKTLSDLLDGFAQETLKIVEVQVL